MVPETTNSVGDTKDKCWFSKTLEQRERLLQKLLNDPTPLVTAIKLTCSDFEVPKPQKLAKKPHQNKRPRTNRMLVVAKNVRNLFFDPSTHYVFRTIGEFIEILYIVFCYCHIILNTKNKYSYF